MMAALSGGFLVGALLTPHIERFPIEIMQIIAYTLSALLWIASVLAPWSILSVLLFGAAAIPVGTTEVLLLAVVQRIVPERLLARVLSLTTSVSAFTMKELEEITYRALQKIFSQVMAQTLLEQKYELAGKS